MKNLLKVSKEKLTIAMSTFLAGIVLTGSVFAADFELELTNEFKEWNKLSPEEKEVIDMPQSFSFEIPNSILKKYKTPTLVGALKRNGRVNLKNVSATTSDSRFSLADDLNMRVENQESTNECWAFSVIKSMETNIALKNGDTNLRDFSERHMDYSLIKTFTDGENENSLNREAGDGGLPIMGLAYLTNGQGAILEESMPFENNADKISLESIDNKEIDTIATGYSVLPTISKSYEKDSSGNTVSVTYKDANGKVLSDEEVAGIRNIIKEHLINNGAIAGFTAGSKSEFYNGSTIFASSAYNCNNSSTVRDHAITIVGWDDNYSKDNFKEGRKPSRDGAYIVLNSYGEEVFDFGYVYISYEDFFIESEIYGITSTSNKDYDNLYQHDFFGGILKLGSAGSNTGYYASVYDRDPSKTEVLNSVGVTVSDYVNLEIYVNPKGNTLKDTDLIKVGNTTSVLEPGYHRININPIYLKGDTFAIVIKQTAIQGEKFNFEIEANVANTAYSEVDSENKSYISLDGETWTNLSALNVEGVDMSKSDVCIKGFTTETAIPEAPSSNVYKIENEYILNIKYNSSKGEVLGNIKTASDVTICDDEGNEILDNNEIIKTGMKLKLSDNSEYILIVRGDTNCDGNLTLTDLSKLLLHYNETKGFELEGNAVKAADLNFDGKITRTDLSQLLVLYNSID